MDASIYSVIELVGTSPESWEKATSAAVDRARQGLKDLRVVEIVQLDMQLQDGKGRSLSLKGQAFVCEQGDLAGATRTSVAGVSR